MQLQNYGNNVQSQYLLTAIHNRITSPQFRRIAFLISNKVHVEGNAVMPKKVPHQLSG